MKNILIIMASGRNIEIKNHLDANEVENLLNEFKVYYTLYRRLIFLKLLMKGETVKFASEILGIRRETGSRWLKEYNEKGFDGLMPNYGNCGRHSLLTDKQKQELKKILSNPEETYTLKDAHNIIKEKFGVDYSTKQVWVITRKELGLNYGKPFIKYSEMSETPELDLKKTPKS